MRVIDALRAGRAAAVEPGDGEALRERFLRHMPQAALSEQQRDALACIIDGADEDATARRLGLSPRRARQLARETVAALGFANSAQLLMRVGALLAEPRPADYTALFDAHGLTCREREICALLLTTGGAQKHIAGQLDLSADTVKFHVKNIYRKLGVQSRTELTARYAGAQAEMAVMK